MQKYLESGRRFSSDGKYREAAIQYLNALKVDDDFAEAHYELAQTYEHLGEFNEAIGELERTVELLPSNYPARVDLGNLLFAGGRTEDAQQQAEFVVVAQPDNPGVHALLSAIAVRQGQKDQALVEIRRALELDPNRAAFHDDLALLQAADQTKSRFVEAELKKAVALDSKSVNPHLLLAAFYANNNRLQEAEKTSWDAVATDPRSLAARVNVAQVILKEGDRARAEEVLGQAAQELADSPQGVRLLADYYVDSGQLDNARTEFSNLVAKYPKNESVRKGYIRVLLEEKDYASARALVAGLMKDGSNDPEAEALDGIVLLNDGNANGALIALSDSARDSPKDAFIQFWLGKAALAAGDSTLAEKSFRMSVELNPSARDAQVELAKIAHQRGDTGLLASVSENMIATSPHTPDGYVWQAIAEMNRDSQDKAEADLHTALHIDPQCSQAYLELGKLRFEQKRFPEGVTLLEQALQHNSDSIEALRLLIGYDLFRKQPARALARLNAQIEKNQSDSCLFDLLTELEIQDKKFDQAAGTAEKAVRLNSADGEAVMLFAQIAVLRGQTANEIAAWERLSNEHPDNAGMLAVLGTLEESRGNLGKAVSYYKKSLLVQPQQPVAANNLAYQMLLDGDMANEALTLAQTARLLMPNSPNAADTLAWAYYCNGTYGFARNLLEDAISTDPKNATMQYHLGMVYSKLKDKNHAQIHLKNAIAIERNSQAAKDAQKALQALG